MIRVLVVDDSIAVRRVISRELSADPDIEVVGTAEDAYAARDQLVRLNPDVVTLDLVMPKMGGMEFLRRVMKFRPVPVIVLSSFTEKGSDLALEALEEGAVDVMCKPKPREAKQFYADLKSRVRTAAKMNRRAIGGRTARIRTLDLVGGRSFVICHDRPSVIAIGASTGGPAALGEVLRRLRADCPGVVIVQHMPASLLGNFARHLNQQTSIEVCKAVNGQTITRGTAFVAPGGTHLEVKRHRSKYIVVTRDGPMEHFQRPSVDVMFRSIAKSVGDRSLGVLLTGMGADGASGLLAMKEVGALTLAQDEGSSAVFGMPRAAIALGGASHVLSLSSIANTLRKIPAEQTP